MWFMSTPCSFLQELSEHCQLHPSWGTHPPRGLHVALLALGGCGCLLTALCMVLCVCESHGSPCSQPTQLCKGHTCTGMLTHAASTPVAPVFVGCRVLGRKALRHTECVPLLPVAGPQ